jgi:hypothetical protein
MNAFEALQHLSLFTSTEGQNDGENVTVQQTGDFGYSGNRVEYRQDVPDTEDVLLANDNQNLASEIKEVQRFVETGPLRQ